MSPNRFWKVSRKCIKAILHYALGLRFGKGCEQKREKNVRKTQLARAFTQSIL